MGKDDSRKDFYSSLLVLIAIIMTFSLFGYFFIKFNEASNVCILNNKKKNIE
jgi:hypothetical protein